MGVKMQFLVDAGSTHNIVDSLFHDNIPESR